MPFDDILRLLCGTEGLTEPWASRFHGSRFRNMAKHLTQVQKLNPDPLHALIEDIEHAMARCRPLINDEVVDDFATSCYFDLLKARAHVYDETQRRLESGG